MLNAIFNIVEGFDVVKSEKATFDKPTDAAKALQKYESEGYECTSIHQRDNTLTYNLINIKTEEREERDV